MTYLFYIYSNQIMSTVTTSTGDSLQAIAPPDVVVTMLSETTNDLLSRHSTANFRIDWIERKLLSL